MEEGACRMSTKSASPDASRDVESAPESIPAAPLIDHSEAEIGSLARQLARGYTELVESHRRSWGISPAEAVEKARMPRDRSLEMVRTEPVEQIAWWTLATAME